MLNKNIAVARKSKGLSQEELAIKLNVVRQTISKWERGLSVPDSDMLINISDVLDIPVHVLLGEPIIVHEADSLKVISEKLGVINFQLAQSKEMRRSLLRMFLIVLCTLTGMTLVILGTMDGAYLNWDYSDPEKAVIGVGIHGFEWLFIRIAPIVLISGITGLIVTRKRK